MSANASNIVASSSTTTDELATQGRKLALAFYVLIKSASLYDVNNHFWDRPLASIEDVVRWHFSEGASKPLALASIEKALFLNGTLIRFDSGTYAAMRFVARALDQLEIQEVAFLGRVSADDLRPVVNLFREAIRARSGEPLLTATLAGIRVSRKVLRENDPRDGDKVDPRLAAVNAYANAAARCAEFRALFLSGGNASLVTLKRCAQELVTTALKFPDLLVGLTQLPRLRGTAAGSMVNAAAFSLLLSRRLELPRRRYSELALNAMLAPIGAALRGDAVVSTASLVSGEGTDVSARVSAATSMMKRFGAIGRPSLVRSAIVHERSLGTSKGDKTYRLDLKPHLFSRIIAVAQAYDEANQDSLPDEALRRVVSQARAGTLDNDVVSILSEVLGVYPVGSTVRLSDGSIGVVVRAPAAIAQRALPVVRVMQGTGGRLIDLSDPQVKVRLQATVPPETQQINVTHCFLL
ncbi:MAG: hypothetical protein NVS3B20_11840 [Polyangiales bacterium]